MSTEVVSLEQNKIDDNRADTIGEIQSFVEDAASPGKVRSLSGTKLFPLEYIRSLKKTSISGLVPKRP